MGVLKGILITQQLNDAINEVCTSNINEVSKQVLIQDSSHGCLSVRGLKILLQNRVNRSLIDLVQGSYLNFYLNSKGTLVRLLNSLWGLFLLCLYGFSI
jgi:hypothetical protein